MEQSGKLIIHAGGESRRLPSYAPAGKLFIPIPVFRWSRGQRLDQSLLDLQEPFLQRIASRAPACSRVMIASGDVFLLADGEPDRIPEADIVIFGAWVKPEEAANFGVLFCDRDRPEKLCTFRQKPSPAEIQELSRRYAFMMDVGVWLLSERALNHLMAKCGWRPDHQSFSGGLPAPYDLYGSWSLHLGEDPIVRDPGFSELSTAVVPLPEVDFFHFGSTSDIVDSLYRIQNHESDQTNLGAVPTTAQPRLFLQNTVVEAVINRDANHSIWIENSYIPSSWTLSSRHVITGVPENSWDLALDDGLCLDIIPVNDGIVIRPYGFDDVFRGRIADQNTTWMGDSVIDWFRKRSLTFEDANIHPEIDLQEAPLFPKFNKAESDFINWLVSSAPAYSEKWNRSWIEAERYSARRLSQDADLPGIYRSRNDRRKLSYFQMAGHSENSVFYDTDLEHIADDIADFGKDIRQLEPQNLRNPLLALHNRMLRASIARRRGCGEWEEMEKDAFRLLRDLIVNPVKRSPVKPTNTLLPDQIVWGRSPVRLDFAGGWADTPPYCIEHGGQVVNIAVDINGQPPIQVFAKLTEEPVLTIKSIDLGTIDFLRTYEDVADFETLGSGFSLAKAAFAICGFHPDFNSHSHETLEAQLREFGGGIEISMVAAVPKGSGLGTSSILAATILGVLSNLSGLNWDFQTISRRTLALEQLLTSGGGWQDQVGGVFPGLKLVCTRPGLEQLPDLRWLPGRFFSGPYKSRMLLYYTGITRIARGILGEIVRGLFLNSKERLEAIHGIAANAQYCAEAVQRNDIEGFAESIRRSWVLNKRLDEGTSPPSVDKIISAIEEHIDAAKLLGAGGGGYLFIVAKDAESVLRITEILQDEPPNDRARFVDFSISETGLCITRS